ncbi:MAG TPA: hypothetical protein VFE47_25685 [Tepidisphaeraceae bacterium]|jgi:hypothetical protein|nr:hypothetical protein [Tepidisphaeraceae bacterium]
MNNKCGVLLGLLIVLLGVWPLAHGQTVKFPTFGISLSPPAHSTFKLVNGSRQVALYAFDKETPLAGAAIQIEALPTNGATLDDMAASIAKKRNGKPVDEKFTIGGDRATKMLESFSDGGRSTTCLVVHGNLLYSFRALMGPTMNMSAEISALLQSVKFSPVESPVPHLKEIKPDPINILGIFTIPGPDCMRVDAKSDEQVFLPIIDRRDQNEDFVVNIQTLQVDPTKTFANVQEAYARGLAAQLHTGPLQFQLQKGVPGLNISQALATEITGTDGKKVTATNRFCMLDRGGGKFVQILFTIQAPAAADVKAYVELSDRMLAGIKLLPEAPAAKP